MLLSQFYNHLEGFSYNRVVSRLFTTLNKMYIQWKLLDVVIGNVIIKFK
jgi:hypothetical protein